LRIGCVIGLGLALASIAVPAHAQRGRGRGSSDTSEWMMRAPRAWGRATRDAIEKLVPIDQAIRAARDATIDPEHEPDPSYDEPESREPQRASKSVARARPETEPPSEDPALATPPAPAAPAPPATDDAQVALPTLAATHDWLRTIEIGAALALAALAAAYALSRRRGEPVQVPVVAEFVAPLALPVGIVREPTAIDAVVEDVVATADAAPAPFPVGGRYEILEEIGRGGMGIVYKARDKRLDRIVALKRLPDTLESEPRYVELLLREARSAARLNHRNIVTVHDVDHENGGWFITMEFLEGSTLAATLKQHRRIAPRSVVWLGEQVVAGLGYAHERGIIHRDVKPANLLVTRDRTLKLMDFGVAKILEEARRRRTLIGGTPAYMAPEQAAGETVDGRADLYALGATFFELLTGKVPFGRGESAHRDPDKDPPDPRSIANGIPDPLAELILAMLRVRLDDRPPSAADVAARLRAIAAALPAPRSAA
jgi:tRNA A-37 threonylcarbamoyl transferase component Bud32